MLPMNDWGPVPALARQLIDLAKRHRAPAEPGRDGPWDVYTTHLADFWGTLLQPIPAVSFPFEGFTRTRDTGRLFTGRAAPEAEAMQHFQHTLTETHEWLLNRVARWLRTGLQPRLPLPFASLSQKALAWTLYAFAMTDQQLRDRMPPLPVTGQLAVDETAQAGDLITLHLNIEQLMTVIERDLHLPREPLLPERHPGGLRTETFLSIYTTLARLKARSRRVARWLTRLNLLIQHSPLTNLIYADVLTVPVKQQRRHFAPLLAVQAGIPVETTARQLELWRNQLARSLLGMVLSPPPLYEQLEWLRRNCQELEPREVNFGASIYRRGWHAIRQTMDVFRRVRYRRAVAQLQTTEAALWEQYIERLGLLADWFVNPPDVAQHGVAFEKDFTDLHIRFLDGLVRHVVMMSLPAMQQKWHDDRHHRHVGMLAKAYLFDRYSEVFQNFVRVLFGSVPEEVQRHSVPASGGSPSGNNVLRQKLMWLLQPDIRFVIDSAARDRFTDSLDNGVELPFPPPNHRGNAPAKILSLYWFEALLSLFPAASVVIQTTQHTEVIDG